MHRENPEYKVYLVLEDVDRGYQPLLDERFYAALAVAEDKLKLSKDDGKLILTDKGRKDLEFWRQHKRSVNREELK